MLIINFIKISVIFVKTMAIKITDDCINCGACEAECPNNAIYGPDELWKIFRRNIVIWKCEFT